MGLICRVMEFGMGITGFKPGFPGVSPGFKLGFSPAFPAESPWPEFGFSPGLKPKFTGGKGGSTGGKGASGAAMGAGGTAGTEGGVVKSGTVGSGLPGEVMVCPQTGHGPVTPAICEGTVSTVWHALHWN